MKANYGKDARRIDQRIEDLKSAPNLEAVFKLPGARCHRLKGDKSGLFAISVTGQRRIIFEAIPSETTVLDDSPSSYSSITSIRIVDDKGYHF